MKKLLLLFFLMSFSYAQDMKEYSPVLSVHPRSNSFIDAIWDVKFNYNLQTITGGLGNAGAVYIPTLNQFWVSRWSTPAGRIYVISTTGTIIDSFTTSGFTGTRNMVYDPVNNEVVCGNATSTLWRVNPTTRATVGQITMPTNITARFISYDPSAAGGAGGFWVGNWNTGNLHFYLVNRSGAQIGIINNTAITGVYGIAYDYWSQGGPYLWVWSQGQGQGFPQNIIQISVATGQPTGIQREVKSDIDPANTNAIAGGLFITDQLIPGLVVLGGVLQGEPDRLFGYEIANLDAGVLAPFNLVSPPDNANITTLPGSTDPVVITWDTSRAGATYKWIYGSPTVPPRILTIPTSSNSLTLTLGIIDSILASFGIPQGATIPGQWDVWAFRNNLPQNDSLKSSNGPRNINITRGIPQLIAFNLVTPANNTTLITSQFNNSPVSITWTRSGQGVRYRWKFWTSSMNDPILNVPSANNGLDTSLTFINSSIDAILAGLGIQPGQSISGQWAVWAYNELDSLKSTQTFNITFQRQGLGEVLVVYDSTLTNGRISRDSIITNLNLLGITYDLFNKGGQTSTNVFSFRNYDRIIWLGEGTSVMSNIQKDSIKAWLNSGTPDRKRNLIIFAEDIGYQFGRTGSTYIDLDFMNNYLGANYVADRPTTGGAQGLIGDAINTGLADSTIGTWPDVLSVFGTTSQVLYRFRSDNTLINAIGNKKPNFEIATFGVDVESLRRAIDSPPGSPVYRMLTGALNYLVIPVELKSFTATTFKNSVTLNWSTATEVNNKGFYVQRKTGNSEFLSIGFVEGKGTTTEIQNYFFLDVNVQVGKYYYRLTQVDFDGSVNYSDAIEVVVNPPLEFSLSQNYPNPFNPTTNIEFTLPSKSNVVLKIYDIIGQEVLNAIDKEMEAGYHKLNLDMSRFSSGVYLYRIDATGADGKKFTAVKKMILSK
ncbi:MAG: T9SS type A sorting domain-containing protein [Ignavibacterium sp.]|nr:T9SS type A sorting domain-containing protein [Ignavibacterium sp.]